mgnify:CR=1 FL=1
MKRKLVTLLTILTICLISELQAQFDITEVGLLPEKVSNNAVCEGFINDTAFVFSFGGIDSTKSYTGIHRRSFRYNVLTGLSESILDLPDTLGKIASGASRIGDIIYIAGGYHVYEDGHEKSSNKIHRYDIINNIFLSDGANIPIAIDDHVQAVWQDSLIYLITGWSNFGNVRSVQIYNPTTDSWQVGTLIPNTNSYRSFGASGTIVNDTIYYFGGATSSFGFDIQNKLRKGIINPAAPTQITWSISTPDPAIDGYRMASCSVDDKAYWIGGSNATYNYDGIAYDGSGGVPTSNRVLWTEIDSIQWFEDFLLEIPMDLRGIGNVNDTIKYLAGGMIGDQSLTDKVYKIRFNHSFIGLEETGELKNEFEIYPNPSSDIITVKFPDNLETKKLRIRGVNGVLINEYTIAAQINQYQIGISHLLPGVYIVECVGRQSVLHASKLLIH